VQKLNDECAAHERTRVSWRENVQIVKQESADKCEKMMEEYEELLRNRFEMMAKKIEISGEELHHLDEMTPALEIPIAFPVPQHWPSRQPTIQPPPYCAMVLNKKKGKKLKNMPLVKVKATATDSCKGGSSTAFLRWLSIANPKGVSQGFSAL